MDGLAAGLTSQPPCHFIKKDTVAFAVDYIKQARVLVVALTQDKNLGQLSSNRPRKQLANKLPFLIEWLSP